MTDELRAAAAEADVAQRLRAEARVETEAVRSELAAAQKELEGVRAADEELLAELQDRLDASERELSVLRASGGTTSDMDMSK